jgi:hypothetical protein
MIPNTIVDFGHVIVELAQVYKWNLQLSIAADVSELMETIAMHIEYWVFCSSQRRTGVAAIGHVIDPRFYTDLQLSLAKCINRLLPSLAKCINRLLLLSIIRILRITITIIIIIIIRVMVVNDTGDDVDKDEDDDDWSFLMAEPTATTLSPTTCPTPHSFTNF